jgi:hypothetical protein
LRYQDFIIETTRKACEGLIRCARALPADKLDWKPGPDARSALDQLQECAQSPTWYTAILEARSCPPFDAETLGQYRAARVTWDTIEKCEEIMNANNEALFDVIRDFPDEELETRIMLPFGGGMEVSMADMTLTQYWNATYHLGQISYIQTLLGDRQMH